MAKHWNPNSLVQFPNNYFLAWFLHSLVLRHLWTLTSLKVQVEKLQRPSLIFSSTTWEVCKNERLAVKTWHCTVAGTGKSTQAHQRFPRKPILMRNNLTYPSLHIHAHVTRCSGVTKVENVNINIMPLLIATDTFLSNLIPTRPFTNKQKTHFWRLPYTG